ncbi:hypothetical protein [Streptomyces sp. URMC 129]|uniref:hypothetical protein n=1 Tax=Streptomyces sp. URMC 129 TaxID=3423407 RepID=UPI003F1DC59F
MSEQQDALSDLADARALAAIQWADESAYERTMRDYDPDAGHDQGWVGYTAHKFVQDRLDRVFSLGKYSVASLDDSEAGLDLVATGLLPGEFENMPRIPPGTVTRADLNGSPGWRCGHWRWLLASYRFGEVDSIPWPRKSPTKQRVAAQPRPDQLTLPIEGEDELFFLADVVRAIGESPEPEIPATTLVVAHSVQRDLGVRELFIGRTRLNKGGGPAWYWRHDLLSSAPGDQGHGSRPIVPAPMPGRDGVADAAVRLRRKTEEGSPNETSG